MALYTEILSDDSDEAGVNDQQFETAVQVWTWMQNSEKQLTVAQAAAAFNTTPAIIRKCVKTSTWMYLDGAEDDAEQSIGHDGE